MTLPTTSELREMLECVHRGGDVDLMLIAPQLAEEIIRLREAIEDEIRSLREPLCSHMPDGYELDAYIQEWEMRDYAACILARIIDRPERVKDGGDA